MPESASPYRHWQLDPEIALLNHGSFGATPTVVLSAQRQLQDALEREPIRFLAPERELEPKLDAVRQKIASLVGAASQDIGFVRNSTDGVNAVLRSIELEPGDEIVVTDHGYNACSNVARFVTERVAGQVRVAKVPFPSTGDDEVVGAIEAQFNDRTRVLLVDHVTSCTGLVFPIERIVASARQRGIQTLVDGAHAPGMVDVDLSQIDPDYYTANHHKWLCGPKASGLLYVRRELQPHIHPTVVSHAANTPRPGRSRFLAAFDWVGTYDPTPILAMPAAIEFLESLDPGGLAGHRSAIRKLALNARAVIQETLDLSPPSPDHMIGSMAAIPLPDGTLGEHRAAQDHGAAQASGIDPLQRRLYEDYQIEIPVFRGPGQQRMVRLSAQAYNDAGQYEKLAAALKKELRS